MEDKKYLEENEEDSLSPREDDDDDEDLEDEADSMNDGEEELENKLIQMEDRTTPFGGSSGGTSDWGSTWKPGSTWGSGGTTTPGWGSTTGGTSKWGSTSSWGSTGSSTSWGGSSTTTGRIELPRTKKIVICDVLDCLVETYQSNGRPGLIPRGIYDIRFRFDVWDKLGCFGADKVFAIIPRNLINSTNGSRSWEVALNYIICSLSEYLRVPYSCFQISTQRDFMSTKEEVVRWIVETTRGYSKSDMIQVGLNSGLTGQSDLDKKIAENCGIDYIDLGQLLNSI